MNYLSNEPIGRDLLSSHVQDRIADVIVSNFDDLKMIGIDGPWGAGKSNLVKILEGKLNRDSNNRHYYFFIYDAWAHQTDSPKRALVEELISFLQNNPKINVGKKKLDDAKNEVLGTLIETTTDTNLSFKWATMLIIIALIITPFTASMSSQVASGCYKLVISAIPMVLFFISMFLCLCNSRGIGDFKDKFIEAYNKGAKKTSKREYKNTEDPSTVSMKKFISVINSGLDEKDVLVIVVDNLDRMPQKNVQDVWTTIQSCFNDKTLYFKKIKVIVPFDRVHLKMCQDGDGDKSYIDDYIDKTFDMVFRVPFPVLDDWEKYFKMQWNEVFRGNSDFKDDYDLEMVKTIFDEFSENISPRSINAFINSVWCLSMLDENREIKNRYRAIFVCKKKEILANPLKAITELEYLSPLDRLFKDDNDFYKSIAALAYSVPLEKGEEVAIYRTLRKALSQGDLDEVKKISAIPTFCSILEKILVRIESNDDLERYMCTLGGLEDKDFKENKAREKIWETIFELLKDDKYKLVHDEDTYVNEAKIILINHIAQNKRVMMKNKLMEELYELNEIEPRKFASTIDALDKCFIVYDIDLFKELKERKVSWNGSFVEFVKDKGDEYTKYKLYCDDLTIDKFYTAKPIQELVRVEIFPELINGGYKLDGLKHRAIDEINKLLPYEQFEQWWSVFSYFWGQNDHLHEEMNKISIPIGTLEAYLQSAKQNKKDSIIVGCLCIAVCKYKNSDFSAYQTIKDYLSADNYAGEVSMRLSKYIGVDELLLKYNVLKNSRLYCAVCKKIFENEYVWWINVEKLLPRLEDVINQLGLDKDDVFEFLSDDELVDCVTSDNINKKMPISFLEYIHDRDDKFSLNCKSVFKNYINSISGDEWEKILDAEIVPYEVKGSVLVGFEWNVSAWNALRKHLVDMCNVKKVFGNVTFLKELLDGVRKYQNIGGLLGDIWDIISKRNITVEEFKAWGRLLFENNKVISDGSTLRRFINIEILKDDECLQILVENLETVKTIRNRAEANERPDFDRNVIELAKKSDKAKALASGLNLKFEENDELTDA